MEKIKMRYNTSRCTIIFMPARHGQPLLLLEEFADQAENTMDINFFP
jgi:hypothetical protein